MLVVVMVRLRIKQTFWPSSMVGRDQPKGTNTETKMYYFVLPWGAKVLRFSSGIRPEYMVNAPRGLFALAKS